MRRALLCSLLLLGPACSRPAASPPPAAQARLVGNPTCPVSGQPVAGSAQAPTFTVTYQGETIGVMCPVCVRDFEKASAEQKQKWLEAARQSAAQR